VNQTLLEPVESDAAESLDTIETPALVLDVAKLDRNVARLRAHLASLDVGFRPHVKSAKSVDVARRLFAEGTGPITVSTLAEADYFAAAGFSDITYAVGLAPDKIGRTREMVSRGIDLSVLIDSVEQARALADAARDGGAMPAVLIEIDCDGHRGGVLPDDPVLVAIADTLRAGGVELRGVLTHAGESYGARGGVGLSEAAEQERAAAVAAARILRQAGHESPVVSVGSTPTAHFARNLDGVLRPRDARHRCVRDRRHRPFGGRHCNRASAGKGLDSHRRRLDGDVPRSRHAATPGGPGLWPGMRHRRQALRRPDRRRCKPGAWHHQGAAGQHGDAPGSAGGRARPHPAQPCLRDGRAARRLSGHRNRQARHQPRLAAHARLVGNHGSALRGDPRMKMTSYWLDTAPPFTSAAPGGPAGTADVAVVGAGFTGLSAALALAKKGAKVVVLEADRVAGAASGRNGGMCNNGFAQDYAAMSAKLGRERANMLYRAFDAGVNKVESIVAEEGIDCHFARVGKLKLAAKPEHYDKIARSQELLAREVDPETRMVPRSEMRAEIGSDRYFGGMLFEKSANMHMGMYGRGLAEAAVRRGATIHEQNPLIRMRKMAGNVHELTTPHGSVRAKQVLLATGTSAVGPLAWVRRRIVPVGAFIIATEPLPPELLDRLTPRRRNTTDTRNFVNYFRTSPDNRLIFGGRARFSARSDATSDAKSGVILRRSMLQVFPELRDVRIDYCWGGLVDMTRDRLPRAGERDGLFYSMGYSGHGTQMATYMGAIMAEVLDGRADLNPLRDFDWPAIPGYFGKPWFLPIVGAYYRFQDFIK
jgi:glycine/D-amino acid oxidase-like deaminating enzyme